MSKVPARLFPGAQPAASEAPARESRIKVVVRKRPLSKKEIGLGRKDILERKNKQAIVVYEPKTKVDLTPYIENHEYVFDQAFDEFTNNEDLYMDAVRPLVGEAFATKAKCTCFAYGQTGSGKTFTMMGPARVNPGEIAPPGLFALAAQDIFHYIAMPEYDNISVHVSFYEIYCGKLHDLLNGRKVLAARDNGQQKVVICGLTEVPVTNVDDFMACINYGLTARTTGVTGANVDSSRSHAILQIALKDDKGRDAGRVSFIDLAGSERGADVVDQGKQTARDGAEINKSLLALKECIRALDLQKDHTPFRGSKLTMVLKESFLGNCRTLMIANLNPTDAACEHTLNTLRYAYRVKELKGGNRGPADDEPTGPILGARSAPRASAQAGSRQQYPMDDEDENFEDDFEGMDDDSETASEAFVSQHPASQLPPPPPTTQGPPPSLVAMLANARNKAGAAAENVSETASRKPVAQRPFGRQPAAAVEESRPSSPGPQRSSSQPSALPQARRNSTTNGSQRSLPRPSAAQQDGTRLNNGSAASSSSHLPVVKNLAPSVSPLTPSHTTPPVVREIQQIAADPHASLNQLAQAHDQLISTILVEEEELIQGHRTHIDLLVDLIKDEMALLTDVERSGSDVEIYVQGLREVLARKQRSVNELANRLASFEQFLQAEEQLSAKFQEKSNQQGGRSQIGSVAYE